jgi:hypothetical protein
VSTTINAVNWAAEQYVRKLSSAYAPGRQIYDPDWGTMSDAELWHKIRRDPIILGAFDLRRSDISSTPWRIVPHSQREDDQALAKVVEEAMREGEDLDEARFMLSEAIFRGSAYAWQEQEPKMLDLSGTGEREWLICMRLDHVDRYRLRIFVDPVSEIPRWQVWNVGRGKWNWEDLEQDALDNMLQVVYCQTEDSLGYGRGLLEAIYFFFYAKGVLLQRALDGADMWAKGGVKVAVSGLKDGSTGTVNATLVSRWLDIIDRWRAKHAIVHDKEDVVDYIAGGSAGSDIVLRIITYLDRAMTRLILASTLTTGAGESDSGSLAQSRTHERSQAKILRRDRRKMDAAISRDLIGQFLRLNARTIEEVGLGKARPPRFESVLEEQDAPGTEASTASTLLGAGVPLRRDELYRKVGYTPPTDEDEVIVGLQREQQAHAQEQAQEQKQKPDQREETTDGRKNGNRGQVLGRPVRGQQGR